MVRGWSLLIFKVGGQRSRSKWTNMKIILWTPWRPGNWVYIHQTWHTYYPWWQDNPYWFASSGVKGQVHNGNIWKLENWSERAPLGAFVKRTLTVWVMFGKILVLTERSSRNIRVKYDAIVMANVKVFFKCRSKVTVNVTIKKNLVPTERPVKRNTHVKYESPISYGSIVMTNIKVFQV